MDLTIQQGCPSCGAALTLHEADRLLQCTFCDVNNYRIGNAPQRFVLPDKVPDSVRREDIIYIPYLRFKGHIFSCRGKGVDYKIIDTTQLGIDALSLSPSLGLRPQAMTILPVTDDITGRFLPLTEKIQKIFKKAALLTRAFSQKGGERLYHQTFIGETISYIYLPTYYKEGVLYDGVLNRKLDYPGKEDFILKELKRFNTRWEPRFLSTICPNCAEVLEGEHDSLILWCENCISLWHENKGRFVKEDWGIVETKRGDVAYLPFWKTIPDISGMVLETLADFFRVTNHPVVIRKAHEERELSMWTPAFKIRPKFLLHLSECFILSQDRIPDGLKQKIKYKYPVTLSHDEALQSLKTVLASSGLNKKQLLPQLPTITIKAKSHSLVYLPFISNGHDLIQEQTGVTVARAVLKQARSL